MAKPPRLRHRISSSPSRLALSSLVSGCKVEQRRRRQRILRFYPIGRNEEDIGRG
ncbi:unnamed protein product [Brassica oleracea var. botrytis]|uniref:Uncharacterized protein n=1 Tax=Brassica cretica TaxID=69181 RepID=A0ABQ7BTM8_BRACR|nr:hypothetical protein DY000_02002149 [Brassica cretica]